MKTLIATLHLTGNTSKNTRERCPDVVFSIHGAKVAAIRTDAEHPELPFADGEIDDIEVRDDAISRVIDEPAWLNEISRVLMAAGELRLTLPASGALAWLDTMNIYRYIVDIGKRGDQPDAALPTGWNRHYSRHEVTSLLTDAGFGGIRIRCANFADREIKFLATMLWRNWIRGERDTEREQFPQLGGRTPGEHLSPLGTTWSISAVKRSKVAAEDDRAISMNGRSDRVAT